MDLKTCTKPGCEPVEQIRGKMGRGDYALYFGNYRLPNDADPALITALAIAGAGPSMGRNPEADFAAVADYHEHVELNDENRNDCRIFCRTCGKATPWNKRDVPGMPGVGLDFIAKRWNESVG